MGTTQPIRDRKQLREFKSYYHREKDAKPTDLRNYTLTMLGLNTVLRISDILNLKWEDVFSGDAPKSHIIVKEQKTGKENTILINQRLKKVLRNYRKHCADSDNPYLFPSPKKKGAHLSRFQAYRIIRRAGEAAGLSHIGCHSLRKTFGYYAWKQKAEPALLMQVFNHSSWSVTLRYLGITQDEKDRLYAKMNL